MVTLSDDRDYGALFWDTVEQAVFLRSGGRWYWWDSASARGGLWIECGDEPEDPRLLQAASGMLLLAFGEDAWEYVR